MNKYKYIVIDGILYGLLLSCFIWVVEYFKSKIEMSYQTSNTSGGLIIDYATYSINFTALVLSLIISSLLARIIVENFNKDRRIFKYWLKTTIITFVISYAIAFFIKIYLIAFDDCQSCNFSNSLHNSVDTQFWLLLLLSFATFTPIYVYVKKALLKLIEQ